MTYKELFDLKRFHYKKIFFSEYLLLSIRVTISIMITYLITMALGLEKSYWAIVAIISINYSVHWSDVFYRSFSRLFMTILGCILGILLFQEFLYNSGDMLLGLVIVVSATLTIYFSSIAFATGIFFSSVFVVLFFTSINAWGENTLYIRIYETLIGSIVSIVVSIVVFPKYSETKIFKDINLLNKEINSYMMKFDSDLNSRIDFTQNTLSKIREIRPLLNTAKSLFFRHSFYEKCNKYLNTYEKTLNEYNSLVNIWHRCLTYKKSADFEINSNQLKYIKNIIIEYTEKQNDKNEYFSMELPKHGYAKILDHRFRITLSNILLLENNWNDIKLSY